MKESMSYQEKQSVLSLINTLLIFGFYTLFVYNRYVAGSPEIINDFSFWGKAFLILIPFTIVIHIVMQILFAIFNNIVGNEEAPTKMDEMDKLIELKSIRVSHWIFITGFFSAMGSMAFGMNPSMMFILLISSGFLAGVVSDIAKIYFYRKGV